MALPALSTNAWGSNAVRRLAWLALVLGLAAWSADFLYGVFLKYQGSNAASMGMFADRKGWLFTHLAGGALTIALGPVQLLRQAVDAVRPAHRWTGRVYLMGLLVACTGAAGLLATSPAPVEIRVAFGATMLAWVATAAVGIAAIRRGQVTTHRAWMMRNYWVTLAPVSFRLLLPSAIALGLTPSPGLIATLLWASWVTPLLLHEAVVRLLRIGRAGDTLSAPEPFA